VNSLDRLYLDYNATSPLSHSVLNWLTSGEVVFANPASQHSRGKQSRKIINQSRTEIYNCFGKNENETRLFFHSGATEAFHTIVYSFAEWTKREGRNLLILTSPVDHPAVTSLCSHHFGSQVKFAQLALDSELRYQTDVIIADLKARKEADPGLIILLHYLWVHNETGLVSPLAQIELLKSVPDVFCHVDAVQAPGKVPEWRSLAFGDIWSFSGHKFGSLKGIGFTFLSKEIPFFPLLTGGGQQSGMRSGTENPQGVKSLSLALGDLMQVDVLQTMHRRQRLEDFLKQEIQGLGSLINTPSAEKNSNTIYFYLDQISSDIALALFDLHGLEISAGSACSSGAAKPSPLLIQLGLLAVAKNGLRLSFAFDLSEEDLNKIQQAFKQVFNKLRSLSI
jgi:cysteine desulfurase